MKRVHLLILLLLAAAFMWVARAQALSKTEIEDAGGTCGPAGAPLKPITWCEKCTKNPITGTTSCQTYHCDQDGQNCHPALSLDPSTGVGDVTGDAVADVAVWDPVYGEVFVFSGADGTLLYTLAAPNPQERGDFGRWLTGVADVNGDGMPDIVVEESSHGEVFLFSGKDGTLLSPRKSPALGRSDAMDLKSRLP
jgi:hypothetical protein